MNKPSLARAIFIYAMASLFLIYEMAVQVSPSVMASALMHDLHIGAFALGMMSGIYFYTYTLMQIPSGLLFDRFKPKYIMSVAIFLCALGTLIFASTHSFYFGCLARLLMGCGSAFAFVSVMVVAADLFPVRRFAVLAGITQTLAALGAMSGQVFIGKMVSHWGWRQSMHWLAMLGFGLIFLVWIFIDYPREVTPKNCCSTWLTTIFDELKFILKNKQSWFIAAYACLLWVPMSSFASLWGVPFLIHFDQMNISTASFHSSLMWLGLAILSPLLGMISVAMNNSIRPLMLSALLGVISFGLIVFFHLHFGVIGILLFLAGGACAGQVLSFSVVRDNNPDRIKGSAIAFNNMAVVISGALFQPLMGRIIDSCPENYPGECYQTGSSLVLAAYVGAFILALFFIKKAAPSRV